MGIGLSLISLVITFFDQGFVVINNAQEWLKMFLLAAIVQVLGWSLIAKWLPKIDLSVAGIILLIQPLGSTLLGYLFLDEVLSLWQLTGALLTMIGISLGTLNKWGELSLKWKQKCKKLING
jgi:drug/metabolite transporter (DMT)-like permease